MPIPTPPEIVLSRLSRVNAQILQSIDALTEEEASNWPNDKAPSCKWHLWHMARWADYVQSLLSPFLDEKTQEIWDVSELAEKWTFKGIYLGMWGAGSGLGNEVGRTLPLPKLSEVRLYAVESFDLIEKRISKLETDTFNAPFTDWHDNETNIGDAVIGYIAHANRHLGMLEAISGILGKDGSVTV
mgnify:CR=1 FL=1